jgi:hypothetical protein
MPTGQGAPQVIEPVEFIETDFPHVPPDHDIALCLSGAATAHSFTSMPGQSLLMSQVLPPIMLNGVTYRVLRLDSGRRGPRFLLRGDDGHLFDLFAQNGQPSRLYAASLVMNLGQPNPLEGVDFFDTEPGLHVRS